MRGLTRGELAMLQASPDKILTDAEVIVSETLVEQGRVLKLHGENSTWEWDEYPVSEQGREALRLYSLIGERMLT